MSDPIYVGGKVFKLIEVDERVVPDLAYCLYCKVTQSGIDKDNKSWFKEIDYQIPLKIIGENNSMKQCPACKKIYVLKDTL